MYYVYEWFIIETGEIIYVGKGTNLRYKVRKHNKFFNEMINRFDCDSRIVKSFENEEDAFAYEYDRVKELKEQGQCVCNIYNGGSGGTTEWWTKDLRKSYSEHNVMKSEKQRQRMSANNPMKDKNVSRKVGEKKSRAVIIGEKEYSSIKAACNELNVCWDVIANWCKKGINPYGAKCRYKDSAQKVFSGKRYNVGSSKPVIYKEKRYESVIDFANEVGISIRTACEWLKRGFNPQGIPCRYENDTKEFNFVNRHKARNEAKAKTVIVNDVEYKNCDEASKMLNIPKSTLYSYLQGKRHSTKYICRYGNQQPSLTKSDNSSKEGSTTNG